MSPLPRISSILATLDDLGANLFFRLPLYLGHRKTAYVVDDVGIWLLCKPLKYVETLVRSTGRKLRLRVRRKTKTSRAGSRSDSGRERKQRHWKDYNSDSYETCSTGSYVSDSTVTTLSATGTSQTLTNVGTQRGGGGKDLGVDDGHDSDHIHEHDHDQDADSGCESTGSRAKTVSSNSWSKWNESVTDGSTWLKSLSTIWGYGSVVSSGNTRKRRRRRRSRDGARGRSRWAWKRKLANLWAQLDAYYD